MAPTVHLRIFNKKLEQWWCYEVQTNGIWGQTKDGMWVKIPVVSESGKNDPPKNIE